MSLGQSRYRLVVFDWDGTLEDSAGPIVESIEHTLQQIGKKPPSAAEIRNIIGLSLVEGLAVLYPQEDANKLALECRAAVVTMPGSKRSDASITRKAELFSGVRATLNRLSLEGIWLAVATGKSRRSLQGALQQHALGQLFLSTRTADDARSKPHPEMLLSILDELGILPAEALMVGDTTYDLAMAHAAGVDCVAVTYGVHSIATLQAAGFAKAFIGNLSALDPMLLENS